MEQQSKNPGHISLRGALEDIKIIATGGMSQIFRARQPSLDRHIVVKKLKDELLANAEAVERFRREAKALASVLHQNIAHVYDFVEEGRDAYILMEFIDGIDLSQVVEKVGNLPPEIAAAILLGVAKGVSFLHAHHLIHRDIKPSNVRLTVRGEVKLMDFGIVMDIDNKSLTRPGMMVGSPFYLSPEQVLGDPISPKADQFLLGICLYEMLTGTRPFKDEGGKTVFQRIREAEFIPPAEMQGRVPQALDRIVRKCLEKQAKDRFESVKDLILELETFLGPTKSSHAADLILKYLDEEALVKPGISYSEILPKRFSWKKALTPPILLIMLAIGVCSFFAGRLSKPTTTIENTSTSSSYPPPKPASKSTK